jgi:hypothetical protein
LKPTYSKRLKKMQKLEKSKQTARIEIHETILFTISTISTCVIPTKLAYGLGHCFL